MLFHEIYGSYYNAVASILSSAVKGELDEKKLKAITEEKAFSESFLEIIPALKSGRWKLLNSDYTTPLQYIPSLPLTQLQLRWLKAISLDKRIKLFNYSFDFGFLKDVEPLFLPDDFVFFDKYSDGDPFDDESYIYIFRLLMVAIIEHKKVRLEYHSAKGTDRRLTCDPYEMEYSEKDDKFRINIGSCIFASTLNVAGMTKCEIIGDARYLKPPSAQHSEAYFIAELINERNALERFLLHFAHFKKEAKQLDDNRYLIKVFFNQNDEAELVIRVLSFGPLAKVLEPANFIDLIKERLIMQKKCGLK